MTTLIKNVFGQLLAAEGKLWDKSSLSDCGDCPCLEEEDTCTSDIDIKRINFETTGGKYGIDFSITHPGGDYIGERDGGVAGGPFTAPELSLSGSVYVEIPAGVVCSFAYDDTVNGNGMPTSTKISTILSQITTNKWDSIGDLILENCEYTYSNQTTESAAISSSNHLNLTTHAIDEYMLRIVGQAFQIKTYEKRHVLNWDDGRTTNLTGWSILNSDGPDQEIRACPLPWIVPITNLPHVQCCDVWNYYGGYKETRTIDVSLPRFSNMFSINISNPTKPGWYGYIDSDFLNDYTRTITYHTPEMSVVFKE